LRTATVALQPPQNNNNNNHGDIKLTKPWRAASKSDPDNRGGMGERHMRAAMLTYIATT